MSERRMSDRLVKGSTWGAGALLVIALVGLVNYLGMKYYLRFDWTSSKLYSLSEKTVNVLAGLGQDIEVTLFLQPGSNLFDPAKELLVQRRLADAVSGVTDLYDAQVAYLDAHLRKLFDGLRRRGLLDDCLVVFTADHGHEIFEHGQFGHGRTLYDEVLRVPLLLWQGGGPPRVVTTPVSLLDVAPTVLTLMGLPIPPEMTGRVLVTMR